MLVNSNAMGRQEPVPLPRCARTGGNFLESSEENVMRSVTALCFAILVCSFGAAKAAKTLPAVDFSTMTCQQFWDNTPAEDRGPFLFWLSGYFGHQKNSPILDPANFTAKTKALADYCAKQPNETVLTAAAKTFLE
jgi:HdeA/HdeB family